MQYNHIRLLLCSYFYYLKSFICLTGQVDEWQSLGNFNVPNSSQQSRRRAHDDVEDDAAPGGKRQDLEHLPYNGKFSVSSTVLFF